MVLANVKVHLLESGLSLGGEKMTDLNYNQLYYFYVVSHEGSIKKACKKLNLSQSTVSGQIRTLEENLGNDLFDRNNKKLVLNAYGKEVLFKANKIFRLGEELIEIEPSEPESKRIQLRFGFQNVLPKNLIASLTDFLWVDAEISTHFFFGQPYQLNQYLEEDKVDVAISDQPLGRSSYHSSLMRSEPMIAVCHPDLNVGSDDFPSSLDRLPFVSFSLGSQIRKETDFFFEIHGLNPDVIGSMDSDDQILEIISRNPCFSIVPELSLCEREREGEVRVLGKINDILLSYWMTLPEIDISKTKYQNIFKKFSRRFSMH